MFRRPLRGLDKGSTAYPGLPLDTRLAAKRLLAGFARVTCQGSALGYTSARCAGGQAPGPLTGAVRIGFAWSRKRGPGHPPTESSPPGSEEGFARVIKWVVTSAAPRLQVSARPRAKSCRERGPPVATIAATIPAPSSATRERSGGNCHNQESTWTQAGRVWIATSRCTVNREA